MSPRKKRGSAGVHRRRKSRAGYSEFGIEAAAYPDGRIAVLLSRYPELERADFEDVVRFIKNARPAQLRRLRSSEPVRTKLERFMREQHRHLSTRRERLASTAVAILMILLLCWLFWDARPQPLSQRKPQAVLGAAPSPLAVAAHGEATQSAWGYPAGRAGRPCRRTDHRGSLRPIAAVSP
ncbi:MAG: hypothetical protein EOP62_09720 [Sphingomonadales bacterium]|nr:MAG: hypothetical protein EOP62_09720 [Sphingomonadales bacterium]